jgi:enamine deaminase RidA (YjgF/YER057c/UK114 family)
VVQQVAQCFQPFDGVVAGGLPAALAVIGVTQKGSLMTLTRYGNTAGHEGLPIISRVVVHHGIAYVCGVTPDPVGDVTTQTRQVLECIDRLLAQAGTDKSRLLTSQVWLADMRLFDEHNAAWNAWVDPKNPPVRACVQANLWRPGMLVEIMVTAATASD